MRRLLALHTEDAVVVNLAGRRVLGRAAFGSALRTALATPLRDVRTAVQVVDVRYPAPDVAVVSCIKTVHDERGGGEPLPAQRGALTYVVVRVDGEWRIGLAQTTPIT